MSIDSDNTLCFLSNSKKYTGSLIIDSAKSFFFRPTCILFKVFFLIFNILYTSFLIDCTL